jgi:hypothetical protein
MAKIRTVSSTSRAACPTLDLLTTSSRVTKDRFFSAMTWKSISGSRATTRRAA